MADTYFPVKILIVDDVPSNIIALKRILEGLDVIIFQATNGYEALELTLQHDFALVLLDVQMPEIDGYETAKAMRSAKNTRHTPVIFVTANAAEEVNAIKGYEAGAVDYITKPINPTVLISKIKVFIDMYSQQQKLRHLNDELDEARKLSETANKAKSSFLANMSHEIRTPLNGIIGTTELLGQSDLNDGQKKYIDVIGKSGDTLLTLINNVLDLSKIEADELKISEEATSLHALIKDIVQPLMTRTIEDEVEISVVYAQDVPDVVMLDPMRIRQILTNLIGNALKFVKKGDVILRISKIDFDYKGRIILRFEIEDNGIGIPKERQKEIFYKFSQADSSTTKEFGGTGLGLAICKQLIDIMGGEIGVVSDVGKGSLFWFEIPTKICEVVEEITKAELKQLSELNVLIADDAKVSQEILGGCLEKWGCRYTKCSNGAEALKTLKKAEKKGDKFDVALIDYAMPKMNGENLAKEIKKLKSGKDIRLIMVTSLGRVFDLDRLKEVGFEAFLFKPIYPRDLLVTLLVETENKRHVKLDTHGQQRKTFSGRVLLVEDDLVNQMVASEMIKKLGCTVDMATNGIEAICKLSEGQPFDVVLMDCMMPKMDGYEATKNIRKAENENQHQVIVAMTANALGGDREKCIDAGMDDYITKPTKQNDLATVLSRYLS